MVFCSVQKRAKCTYVLCYGEFYDFERVTEFQDTSINDKALQKMYLIKADEHEVTLFMEILKKVLQEDECQAR